MLVVNWDGVACCEAYTSQTVEEESVEIPSCPVDALAEKQPLTPHATVDAYTSQEGGGKTGGSNLAGNCVGDKQN